MNLTTGKLRGLQQLADANGFLTMCAIDHRGSLKRALNPNNPAATSYQDMVDFKLDLCRVVAPFASAILLDPIYGAAQAISAAVLSGHTGLLVSTEASGYSGDGTARVTEFLPGWSVRKAKKMGASAVKLLVYYRPDLKKLAARQLELVSRLAEDCIREDITLLVEPVSYPVEQVGVAARKFADMKPGIVIETARQMTALPIDVLKAEFPTDPAFEPDEATMLKFCRELDQASQKPWVILSAGVDYATFKKQVEIASRTGASGFLAGRALWQEGVQIKSREERMEFFRNTAAPRLRELVTIVEQYARPWYAKMGSTDGAAPPVTEDWYKKY